MQITNWPENRRAVLMMDIFDENGNVIVGSATFEEYIQYTYLGLEGIPTTQAPYCVRAPDTVMKSHEVGYAEGLPDVSFKTIITQTSPFGNIVLLNIPHLCLRTKFSIHQEFVPVSENQSIPLRSIQTPNYTSGVDLAPVWKIPAEADYEYWLLAGYPQEHSKIYFFAVKKSNRGFIGRPPLPNVYDDCKFCAGRSDSPWCSSRSNDVNEIAKGALNAFYKRPWQSDLLTSHASSTSKRIFQFNMDGDQLPTTTAFGTDMSSITAPWLSRVMGGVSL